MKHKKHVSTLTYTAMAVTAAVLLSSFVLFAASVAALWKSVGFATVCFFILMVFGVVVAVCMTIQQCRVGVYFYSDRVEFRVEEEPVVLKYHDIKQVSLLDLGQPPTKKKKQFLSAQFLFELHSGGVCVVPIPKLNRGRAMRLLAQLQRKQERS